MNRTIFVLACSSALTGAACLARPEGTETTAAPESKAVDPVTGKPLAPLAPAGPRHEHAKMIERDAKDEHEVLLPKHLEDELEQCHAKGGGKVRVRVRRENGRRTFDVVGARSLDPTEQRCVLDSLQRLREDETPGALGTRSDMSPTGFTSILTIEW